VTVAFNRPVIVDSFSITDTLGSLPGTTAALTQDLDIETSQTVGAIWTPSIPFLKPGSYVATVAVRDAQSNTPLVASWPFTVVESPNRLYLPIIQR
jgi:hypothetical protein